MRDIGMILRTDGYKFSHWPMLPDGTEYMYSYMESRGGEWPELVQFGLTYYLKEYLAKPITMEMVEYAAKRLEKYFGTGAVFNQAGFEHMVKDHGGQWALRIKAVPEGTVVPLRNVLMTIENTCPKCAWAVNYVETLLLKIWYPITVATQSRECKKIINDFLVRTGDPAGLPYKLHDFGYRGVSSEESAAIGGAAHLVNFAGSDTYIANELIYDIYGEEMASDTIPATEHSIMGALGENGEREQMYRFLKEFGNGPFPAIACVSDTFDIFRACSDYWGKDLKPIIERFTDKVLVVRPDSGNPHQVVVQVLETLERAFGSVVNDKGYKVLNHVRVIQGDGINLAEIRRILEAMEVRRYSADNVAFGMGGALLQQVNRDTLKFAIKASAICINGQWRDVWKSPVTDSGKRSKRGKLKLVEQEGVLMTVSTSEFGRDIMETVFETGVILSKPPFAEIRERAALKAPLSPAEAY
jgi:nicotinamide phosphoribosyltransferase